MAFQLVLSRRPSRQEQHLLRLVAEEQRAEFHANDELARQLLEVGQSPRVADLDAVTVATWTVLAGIILNLDESLNN
jgi:hypothetical protein